MNVQTMKSMKNGSVKLKLPTAQKAYQMTKQQRLSFFSLLFPSAAIRWNLSQSSNFLHYIPHFNAEDAFPKTERGGAASLIGERSVGIPNPPSTCEII